MRCRTKVVCILSNVAFPLLSTKETLGLAQSESPSLRIQVCQNKDCKKRYRSCSSLPDTLHDLLPPGELLDAEIESTGCLSECGKGPNVRVINKKNKQETILHDVTDTTIAAVELQAICSVQIPSKLIAATSVMEKAQKATSVKDKEKFLCSVIKVLSADGSLEASSAAVHARILRAIARFDAGLYREALEDAEKATELLLTSPPKMDPVLASKAYRVEADSHEALGNFPAAIRALKKWAVFNPLFRTKINNEIQCLQQATNNLKP